MNTDIVSKEGYKRSGVEVEYTPEQASEYIKCMKDPVYFIRNYVKIISLDKGVIPFEVWDWQEDLVNDFLNNRFVITKIGRQSGKTQTVSAFMLWCVLFNPNYVGAILANKHATAIEIVDRIKKSYVELPIWLQQGVSSWNKLSIELDNGSKIFSNATSIDAIRGYTINLLFLDEFAIVQNNIQEEFWNAVFPTISSGETTKIFIASTPKGLNKFYKIWDEAVRKKNGFKPVEVHWSQVPGRDDKWRIDMISKLTERGFNQEFNTEFLGSSMTLISGTKLGMLVDRDPIHQTQDGFKFYDEVDRSRSYVMVVDTAHGGGFDYSAFIVVDVTEVPYRIVCTFRNNSISTILYPKYIMEAATYYNNAQVLIETNDLGSQVCDIMHYDMEYENLITTAARTKSHEVTGGFGVKAQMGVRTTKSVKNLGCSTFKSMVETDQIILSDFDIRAELTRFALNKVGSYEAEDGNDDLAMCCVLFAWMTAQSYFKDLTGTDVIKRIYSESGKDVAEMLVPFGIIDDGRGQSRELYGNDLWEEV